MIIRKNINIDRVLLAHSYNDVAQFYVSTYDYKKAERLLKEGLNIYLEESMECREDSCKILNGLVSTCINLGFVYYSSEQYDKAKDYIYKVLHNYKDFCPDNCFNYANAYQVLGNVYLCQLSFEKAEECLNIALNSYSKIKEIDTKKLVADVYEMLGLIY